MENFFEVTEILLKKIKPRFYGGGNQLKVGDKVITGYINMYSNVYGTPPSKFIPEEVGLSLQLFVLNEKDDKIYQLYEKID